MKKFFNIRFNFIPGIFIKIENIIDNKIFFNIYHRNGKIIQYAIWDALREILIKSVVEGNDFYIYSYYSNFTAYDNQYDNPNFINFMYEIFGTYILREDFVKEFKKYYLKNVI